MKLIGIFGLTAVAALAAIAITAVGTASATVLCKTAASPCGESYPATTSIEGEVTFEGPPAVLEGAGLKVECNEEDLIASIASAGGSGKPVSVQSEMWTMLECPPPHNVAFVKHGSLEVHHTSNGDGVVTAEGTQIILDTEPTSEPGFECKYEINAGAQFGTLYGGSEPLLEIGSVFKRISGSLLQCKAELQWTADLHITTPTPLYVAAS